MGNEKCKTHTFLHCVNHRECSQCWHVIPCFSFHGYVGKFDCPVEVCACVCVCADSFLCLRLNLFLWYTILKGGQVWWLMLSPFYLQLYNGFPSLYSCVSTPPHLVVPHDHYNPLQVVAAEPVAPLNTRKPTAPKLRNRSRETAREVRWWRRFC